MEWTKDGITAPGISYQIVTDLLNATYNNVLTVTGRDPGIYICNVTTEQNDFETKTIGTVITTINVQGVSYLIPVAGNMWHCEFSPLQLLLVHQLVSPLCRLVQQLSVCLGLLQLEQC